MPWAPDSAFDLLAAAELPRVGERRFSRLQDEARRRRLRLRELLDWPAGRLRDELGLPRPAIERLCTARAHHEARCAALARRLAEAGVRIERFGSSGYPSGWARHGEPPPPLAFAHGNAALLHLPIVSLLSSRVVGETTVTASAVVARAAANAGCALAVGGMKTTHRIAAATVRALGAARLIVLDRGLLAAFGGALDRDPFGLGGGRVPFDGRRTLVLSPFRPDDHAVPPSGRRRDALLAALGNVVVALSARPAGETERVCLRALARGQRVWCWGDANPALLAAGARPVAHDDLDDALQALVRDTASSMSVAAASRRRD